MDAETLFFALIGEIDNDIMCLCLVGLAKLHLEGKLGEGGGVAKEALKELLRHVEEG